MSLTPTGWTILGFLSLSPRNGYQLRAAVQRSVGTFWGVSYGQLYPQLRMLAQAGLIEETEPPEQADTTARQTWWRLTEEGAGALREWLLEPAAETQVRDESLVKLLFSDHAGQDAMRGLIADRRDRATLRKQNAEAIVPGAHWPDATESPEGRARQADLLASWLVRAHAIAMAEAELSWCATAGSHDHGAAVLTRPPRTHERRWPVPQRAEPAIEAKKSDQAECLDRVALLDQLLTQASMRAREKSLISRPCTISYLPSLPLTGKDEIRPSGTP